MANGTPTSARTELATLGWVYRRNTSRLHGYLNDVPTAEFEEAFYVCEDGPTSLIEIQ